MELQDQQIGALWKKISKKGHEYCDGTLEMNGRKYKIVMFKIQNKKNDKQPDYNIYLSKEII